MDVTDNLNIKPTRQQRKEDYLLCSGGGGKGGGNGSPPVLLSLGPAQSLQSPLRPRRVCVSLSSPTSQLAHRKEYSVYCASTFHKTRYLSVLSLIIIFSFSFNFYRGVLKRSVGFGVPPQPRELVTMNSI